MRETLKHAIQLYGKDMQLNIAVEEFAELTKEICKHKRGADNTENIVEEIADCYIMLSQLEVIFDLSQETINNAVQKKLKRLEDRIKETIHVAEMHGNFEPIDFDAPESTEDNNFLLNRFMKTEYNNAE